MQFTFNKATKEQIRLRMALCGPAGSGKTYTALAMATNLGQNVALIDTENGSANKYADKFDFSTLVLPNFTLPTYIGAINAAVENGFDVVIIDSLSHAWNGAGGALQAAGQASKKYGNNEWAGWADVTPLQDKLIDTILRCPIHLVATMRTKTEWLLQPDKKGRMVPSRVGLQPVQKKGVEYEFDIVGDMDMDHNLIITKTRCETLDGMIVNRPNGELADTISAWLNDGEPEPDRDSDEWKRQILQFHSLGKELYDDRWDTVCLQSIQKISRSMFTSSNQIKQTQLNRLIEGMKQVKGSRKSEDVNITEETIK